MAGPVYAVAHHRRHRRHLNHANRSAGSGSGLVRPVEADLEPACRGCDGGLRLFSYGRLTKLSRNASAVSDAPHMEWQVDFLEACGGASDTAV
jgi:hypothetical protein